MAHESLSPNQFPVPTSKPAKQKVTGASTPTRHVGKVKSRTIKLAEALWLMGFGTRDEARGEAARIEALAKKAARGTITVPAGLRAAGNDNGR